MFLIAGLGNPGKDYDATRHNIGFAVVDVLARRLNVGSFQDKFKGLAASASIMTSSGNEQCILLKPSTFMNLSGTSVQPAMAFYKIPLSQVIVVHDELDLPLGQVRLKLGGGAGGHNGLRSITASVGADFLRVRAGIGKPVHKDDVVNFVLGRFSQAEKADADILVEKCADAVLAIIKDGLLKAQQTTHTDDKANKPKEPKAPKVPKESKVVPPSSSN